jgi:hypothetical protein
VFAPRADELRRARPNAKVELDLLEGRIRFEERTVLPTISDQSVEEAFTWLEERMVVLRSFFAVERPKSSRPELCG